LPITTTTIIARLLELEPWI